MNKPENITVFEQLIGAFLYIDFSYIYKYNYVHVSFTQITYNILNYTPSPMYF